MKPRTLLPALLILLLTPLLPAAADWAADLKHTWQVASGLLPHELSADYSVCRVGLLPGGEGLRWVFTPRGREASLLTAVGVLPGAESYEAVVRLGGDEPLPVGMGREGFGGTQVSSPAESLPTRQWRRLTVPGDGLPQRCLRLRLENLEPGTKYVLDVQRIVAQGTAPAPPQVTGLDFPAQARAGSVVEGTVRGDWGAAGPGSGAGIELRARDRLLVRVPLRGLEAGAASVALPVPAYLSPGRYTLRFTARGASTSGGLQRERPLEVTPAGGPPPLPGFDRRGEEVLIRDYPATSPVDATSGSGLYRLPVAAGFDPYGLCADSWMAERRFDYTWLEEQLASLLAQDPQARVLLQVWMDSPIWWEQANPKLLAPYPRETPDLSPERKLSHASWFAEEAQAASAEALRNLVRFVEEGPLRAHIFGYELVSGRRGEWRPWQVAAEYQDDSVAAHLAFRTWLQRQYREVAALRGAWGQPVRPVETSPEVRQGLFIMQWAQVKVPPAKTLLDPAGPLLYDPSGQQDRVDYQRFLGDHTAEFILRLVQAGRAAGAADKRWGACYGHLFWHPRGELPPTLGGQLGLGRLLDGLEVDFLTGPPGADLSPTTASASVQLRGKLALESHHLGLSAAARDETPRRVALVVGEDSLAHLSPASGVQRVLLEGQVRELTKSGLSFEVWLLPDFLAAPDYALNVMAATYAVSPALRTQLQARLHRAGKLNLWVLAPGAAAGFLDAGESYRLTGLKLTLVTQPGPLWIEVPPGDPNFTRQAVQAVGYGVDERVFPRLVFVADAETAGTLKGSPWAGLGLRRERDWISAFSAAPGVSAEILHSLATLAGIEVR